MSIKTTKLELLLLVEDDENDEIITKRIIRNVSADIAVVVHKFGETALAYLRQVNQPPQLVLLDIGLPKMDGITFAREMKKIDKLKPVPVIILTGVALDIAQAHAADIAAGYIIKPIKVEHFKEQLIKLGFTT